MDLSSQIVPALVVLAANLLSGHHSSLRWEYVTAMFGWSAAISFVALVVVATVLPGNSAVAYLAQLCGFCLLTALARDYERILKPLFPWNR